jgi:hypothetical protein
MKIIKKVIKNKFIKNKEIIFLKQNALKNAGYDCEIWVYNSKGEKVETYM